VQVQKISILPPQKGSEFPGGGGVGGSVKPKHLKKCVNWNFQRGGGALEKNPFRGGGMEIFWNYTLIDYNHFHFLDPKKVDKCTEVHHQTQKCVKYS